LSSISEIEPTQTLSAFFQGTSAPKPFQEEYKMKITTFNPMIVTKDAQSVIALFEAMGFERRHMKTGINDADISSVRMRYTNEDGKVFHVDVASAPVPKDITTIRMNIDNFDEAYAMLEEKGFKNAQGDRITETGSSRSTMMIAPSGFSISVSQHIKDHD
jgi:hypothetical protein